ncbi:hypothetical protein PoB_004526900 [Plakobranchus ocellatus]|uniref:Uncharacterized protein n=1 Tax=Plakobranchus ocellatus TaxID=259542 RepID=A0AAV4BKB3_9GAST|nr:hypothetical protein PoB_004526900 [Plakobranchus ocellatus]
MDMLLYFLVWSIPPFCLMYTLKPGLPATAWLAVAPATYLLPHVWQTCLAAKGYRSGFLQSTPAEPTPVDPRTGDTRWWQTNRVTLSPTDGVCASLLNEKKFALHLHHFYTYPADIHLP